MRLPGTNILIAIAVVLIVIVLLVTAISAHRKQRFKGGGAGSTLQSIDSLVETRGAPKQQHVEFIDGLIAKVNRMQGLD